MRPRVNGPGSWMLAAVSLMAGCTAGEPAAPEPKSEPQPVSRFAVEELRDEGLPETHYPLPPLDGGHLVVAIPREWHVAPRDKRWIVRIESVPGRAYPSILITGGGSIADSDRFTPLDGQNVEEYAKRVQVRLDEEFRDAQRAVQENLDRARGAEKPVQQDVDRLRLQLETMAKRSAPKVKAIRLRHPEGVFYGVYYVRGAQFNFRVFC